MSKRFIWSDIFRKHVAPFYSNFDLNRRLKSLKFNQLALYLEAKLYLGTLRNNINSTTYHFSTTLLKKILITLCMVLAGIKSFAQHNTTVKAALNDSTKTLYIQQRLEYLNQSNDTLNEIYLNDWMNAFSDTRTPLARRFFEDYDRDFHFARKEKRGGTTINSIATPNRDSLTWSRPLEHPDIIVVQTPKAIFPGEKFTLDLNYAVKLPSEDFTKYGYSNRGRYQLRYWFITPGMYKDGWKVYSHKNMNDLFSPLMNIEAELNLPQHLMVISPYNITAIERINNRKKVFLEGNERFDTELYLTKEIIFEDYRVDSLHVLTNIEEEGISPVMKSMIVSRIVEFLKGNLGTYPHEIVLSTQQNYASNPVYGLNQLPKFIRPFPEGFSYDLKQLKTITESYLKNSLLLNPREEKWIFDGIQTYLMMRYIDENYPNLKLLGSLSDVFGVRWFHAADLKYNDQYPLLYLYMARQNLDQPLTTPQDSLIKFNRTLGNPSKAGIGLNYLDKYLENNAVSASIKEFYSQYKLKPASLSDFENILKKNTDKNVDWFFGNFLNTNEKIDFTISNLKVRQDSLEVTIKNRNETGMPVQLYGLAKGKVVYKNWIENVDESKTVTIPSEGIKTIAINHEGIVPEVNRRNNYQSVSGILNKPIQFKLFKDVENPEYNQLFFMPTFQYNLYDGLALGTKIYNTSLLNRNFQFEFAPLYGLSSQTFVGGASVSHEIFFSDDDLYSIRYGISGSRFSYGYGLLYQRFTPYLVLSFRNSYMRNSRNERILVRNVNVMRDQNPNNPLKIPDYSVFNINYSFRKPGLVEGVAASIDFQLAEKFSKSAVTLEYRKLLQNDRQINVRFFGGAFLYNDLPGSDYFSFALDRPSDYLFDYNYYGRSETSGLFSQQIIMAEGGFKSMLEPKYANQWITTVNASTTIWKWIFAYTDVGVVKNKYESAKLLYDSGIRMSIINNYFELFFPIHSSEGWEFNDGNYDQKIRFIATLDLKTLTGLFTREWF